jgi:hypothetical protein
LFHQWNFNGGDNAMKFAAKIITVCLAAGLLVQAAISAPFMLIIPQPPKPPTLEAALWSAFVAATNGQSSHYEFNPSSLGGSPSNVTWNVSSPMFGQRGFTGFSLESNFSIYGGGAQWGVPVTAVTRRHVYIRGHSNGATNGALDTVNFHNEPINFLTSSNTIVQAYAIAAFREYYAPGRTPADECLLVLSNDLPDSIQPVAMVDPTAYAAKVALNPIGFWPGFEPRLGTDQLNLVATLNMAYWNPNQSMYVGGDSGSPDFFILNGAIYMIAGRTTSGWSAQMQADCDALSRYAGLDPANYQIQLLDLTQFSDF